MAISLSNHEDRIKALENKTFYYHNLIGIGDSLGDALLDRNKTYSLYDSIGNYTFLLITYSQNDNAFDETYRHRIFNSSLISVTDFRNGVVVETSNVEAYFRLGYVNDRTVKCYGMLSQSGVYLPNDKGPRLYITGLKLYYNFSYNIYRLANSISFHFFKCLINSFKGGVKEIWQLV